MDRSLIPACIIIIIIIIIITHCMNSSCVRSEKLLWSSV
jgi:hypothetical protein